MVSVLGASYRCYNSSVSAPLCFSPLAAPPDAIYSEVLKVSTAVGIIYYIIFKYLYLKLNTAFDENIKNFPSLMLILGQ